MKIAITGQGLMGLSCAVHLIKSGVTDLHVFFDPQAKPASRCAGGMLAPFSEGDSLAPDVQALAVRYSLPFWKELSGELGVFYRETGTLALAHAADRPYLTRFEQHLPQGTYEHLDRETLQDKEPHLSKNFRGGLWVYDEAFMDTAQILKAMQDFVMAHATVENRAVDPDDLTGFDKVIDCRGAYAGIDGMRKIKGERILLHAPDLKLQHCIRLMHPRYPVYIVPHDDNHYVVGASMIEDNESDKATVRSVMELLSAFASLHPLALESEIVRVDAGHRPAFCDHVPQIHAEGDVIRCNGLYRHGFLLAPAMAQAVVRMVSGQAVSSGLNIFVKVARLEAVH